MLSASKGEGSWKTARDPPTRDKFNKAVDAGFVPMEESVKCVVLQTSIMHLSANQTQVMGYSKSCMIFKPLLLGGGEGQHIPSGAYLD
eukprot:8494381-Ditylum_brightwellii.AAC.1